VNIDMSKLLLPLLISQAYAFTFNSLLSPVSGRGRVVMMQTPDFDSPQPIYKQVTDIISDDQSVEPSLGSYYGPSGIYPKYHGDNSADKFATRHKKRRRPKNDHDINLGGAGNPTNTGNPMNTGNARPPPVPKNNINITFDDVAGCDEAKYELEEIVDFLKNPDKYHSAGAKVPKGVLLDGPPGTGKTLLARAVASEANVTFIQISASEFVEMYVGLGASRVRDIFNIARNNAPCVIFIDEIDAVGKKRGHGSDTGGNSEREQTLNQILTSMDGFKQTDSIVVLAATNRAETLDTALTRSGRFDRKVRVAMPDVSGRRKILDVHLKRKTVSPNTDLDEIALLTSGFSGADIENMANEAVILAIRDNKSDINSTNLIDAYEKIMIGLPMISKPNDKFQDELVAYHEAGHAIPGLLFRDFFDVRKVTIVPNTNGACGYTLITPKEHYMSYPTKKFMLAELIVAMGGRAAEMVLYNVIKHDELFHMKSNYSDDKLFHGMNDLDVSTGASSDLKRSDHIARNYIEIFGYGKELYSSDKIIQIPDNPGSSLSDEIKSEIDDYVIKLVNYGLDKAIDIIENNMDTFNKLAIDLIEKKSVDIKYLDTLDVGYF
jgi:cell division protease FtsH